MVLRVLRRGSGLGGLVTWLRIDDGFMEHPKVLDLSDRAFRLHLAGLCYCARNLTDGLLVMRAVKVVCAITDATRRHVVELRDACLWQPLEDGYRIRDFLDYNPDAATVKAQRAANAERQRKYRGNGVRNALRNGTPDPDPSPEGLKPNRPVEESLSGKPVDLSVRAAAQRLLDSIRVEHHDQGTRAVILAYAQELTVQDFDSVRRELEKRRGSRNEIRQEAKWANGALAKRARERAADAA